MRGRRVPLQRAPLFVLVLLLGLFAAPAAAQTVGARVGASVNPDQFVFGAHVETAPVIEQVYFRPNVEIGIGDDTTVVGLNFEFVYKFPSRGPWVLYAGGGPALNVVDTERATNTEGGLNILIGAEHTRGLFFEAKGGALDSPDFKITVGYSWRWR